MLTSCVKNTKTFLGKLLQYFFKALFYNVYFQKPAHHIPPQNIMYVEESRIIYVTSWFFCLHIRKSILFINLFQVSNPLYHFSEELPAICLYSWLSMTNCSALQLSLLNSPAFHQAVSFFFKNSRKPSPSTPAVFPSFLSSTDWKAYPSCSMNHSINQRTKQNQNENRDQRMHPTHSLVGQHVWCWYPRRTDETLCFQRTPALSFFKIPLPLYYWWAASLQVSFTRSQSTHLVTHSCCLLPASKTMLPIYPYHMLLSSSFLKTFWSAVPANGLKPINKLQDTQRWSLVKNLTAQLQAKNNCLDLGAQITFKIILHNHLD